MHEIKPRLARFNDEKRGIRRRRGARWLALRHLGGGMWPAFATSAGVAVMTRARWRAHARGRKAVRPENERSCATSWRRRIK